MIDKNLWSQGQSVFFFFYMHYNTLYKTKWLHNWLVTYKAIKKESLRKEMF